MFNRQIPSTQSWTSLFRSLTSSPGLNAGRPMYGHPSHRKASPRAQLPQLPSFPCTVKSTSAKSPPSNFMLSSALSAFALLPASSSSIFRAKPQVQSLQARRRFPAFGRHSGAIFFRKTKKPC